MANREDLEAWERFVALLARELPVDQLRAELEQSGVSVDEGVSALRALVRRAYQHEVRDKASREMASSLDDLRSTVQEVGAWSFQKILDWLDQARKGAFGSDVATLTLAYHRNKEAKDLTEAEARSLVVDILASKK